VRERVDETDFTGLYRRHSGDVLRFALYLTGSRAEAEDVAAETFARAWMAHGEIRVGTVKAYLLMIARNLCRTLRRGPPAPESLSAHEVDRSGDPGLATDARDELARVLACLQELAEPERRRSSCAPRESSPTRPSRRPWTSRPWPRGSGSTARA
jgi:RNA polymerase sigma-70 factor (ECF subfamily)